ncbi:Dbl homology (DH) domain containing protein [Lactarius tabidus]
MSTAASGSRPDVGSSKNSTQTVKDTSTLSVTSPYSAKPAYGNGASIDRSPRSATSFSRKSIESVPPPASWSEGVEEDLVTHLIPRERTRQEVLWEFVTSEERYATELLKMKDTFIIPLLHPYATSPVASPHQLPDNLRQCLEVIENRILSGHLKLSEGLRKRYDEQYPLVRSLVDVVIANSHILWGYADYIIHLERALEQADDVISTSNMTKRPKKKDADEWLKVCTFLRELENGAQDRGETGLAISLSKPFQRLLKYPLLFQNLLFHTDPSTFEYESTLRMVAEVENIVRSIEDEKIQEEERAKTRDILARIEGLGKVKLLAAPEPSRVLVEERESSDASVETTQAVRGKKSFKRLSDVLRNNLGGVGGKKDLWLVVFNDVVLRCQRTGTTSLPLGSARASRAKSVPKLQGKSEVATTGWRNPTAQPRNLYKFIEIENWTPSNSVQPRGGVMSMEEAQIQPAVQQPRIVPMPDDDEDGGVDSDGSSDRKSKMSFCYWSADKKKPNSVQPREGIKEVRSRTQIHSGVQPTPMPDDDSDDSDSDGSDRNKSKASKGSSYWSADKITLQNPIAKRRPGPGGQDTRRNGSNMPSGRSRELSMNAKFGHRLVSADSSAARPSSRRTVTPSGRRRAAPSDEGHSKKITATRPARGGSARTPASSVQSTMQSLNTSQNSAATRTTTAPPNKVLSEEDGVGLYRQVIANDPSLNKVISSPAPSEDSGVGLYRQMMANDLSQNND